MFDLDKDGLIGPLDVEILRKNFPQNSLIGKEIDLLTEFVIENQILRN